MINIINQIFRNTGFKCLKELIRLEEGETENSEKSIEENTEKNTEKSTEENTEKNTEKRKNAILREIYVNESDEMYFIVEGELKKNILNEIIGICLEAESNEEINKSYKSNWVLILLTAIEGDLSWEQRKSILFIEENKYFCRKYVLWYNDDEMRELEKLCKGDYSTQNINNVIENYDYFINFKKLDDKGYECLSRIFIKLPYLNLADLETTDKTILDFVKEKLDDIHKDLIYKLETGDIESLVDDISLSDKEEKDIDKKIASLIKEKK